MKFDPDPLDALPELKCVDTGNCDTIRVVDLTTKASPYSFYPKVSIFGTEHTSTTQIIVDVTCHIMETFDTRWTSD